MFGIDDLIGSIAVSAGGKLLDNVFGGHKGHASRSVSRAPAPWEPDAKKVWDRYIGRLTAGGIGGRAGQYESELANLAGQLSRPAFSVSIGGQAVPVVPRRNISLLAALSGNAADRFGASQYENNLLHDTAMALEAMRYRLPQVGESGELSRTPGLLESLGQGVDIWGRVSPLLAAGDTTTNGALDAGFWPAEGPQQLPHM